MDDKEFIIALPFFKNAYKDNYNDIGYKILSVDKNCQTLVFKTYLLSELKDEVSKFLNERF